MRSLTLLLLTIFLCVCCSRSDSQRNAEIVEYWQGREITLPEDMTFVVQGDTVDYDIYDCDYKILYYVDSLGCTPCKMNLSVWENFLAEANSNPEISVKFIMVIHSNNVNELIKITKKYHFNYPIVIDKTNFLKSMNKLSNKVIPNTLLLNDKNVVIIEGNPLVDSNIKHLYEKELGIDSIKNYLDSIQIYPRHLSMGVFSSNEEKNTKFRLINKSNKPITIKEITTSCNCISAWAECDSINPDCQSYIYVSCNPENNDTYFERYINILLDNNININCSISGFKIIDD